MKKLLLLTFLVVLMTNAVAQTAEEDVKSLVATYMKGIETRDFQLIREACYPTVELMGTSPDGGYRATTLEEWSKRFEPGQKPFESIECTVRYIHVVRSIAQARIDFVIDGDRKVTDFLNIAWIKGRWLILNIVDG